MSSSFEKSLSDANGLVLFKQASGGYQICVTDESLVPMVQVSGFGKTSEFALDKIGLMFSDADRKFYSEETGDEVIPGDFNDLAIEHVLFRIAGKSYEVTETSDGRWMVCFDGIQWGEGPRDQSGCSSQTFATREEAVAAAEEGNKPSWKGSFDEAEKWSKVPPNPYDKGDK